MRTCHCFCFVRNLNGRTALHEACARGLNDYVRELFNNGAEIKTRDSDGNSALHVSTKNALMSLAQVERS